MRYAVFVSAPYTEQKCNRLYWWMHKQVIAGRPVFKPIVTEGACTLFAEPLESSLLVQETH